MARIDKKKKLRPSILDRLIDNEPHNSVEADPGQHQKLNQLRISVRRDLESLLNTRFKVVEPAEEYTELEQSLLNYGLPDLATVNIFSSEKKKSFTQTLESMIKQFEPRFKSVKVSFLDNEDNTDRTLRFRIDAMLYADPMPEVIIFDSVLEPVTRTVNIEETRYG